MILSSVSGNETRMPFVFLQQAEGLTAIIWRITTQTGISCGVVV